MHVRVPDASTILVPSTHHFRYDASAPWWWQQAHPSDIVDCTETTTMFILAPFLLVAGIGFLCWFFFTVAVFALPCATGLMAALWAFDTGAGLLGAVIIGFVAGAATFILGQIAFACVPWAWLRLLIVLLYTVPVSTSALLTHSFSVCAEKPILPAIDTIAVQSDGCSPSCSRTSRTARTRTTAENFFTELFMRPSFQEKRFPPIPKRFTPRSGH